ncbi:hypothetical protein GR925_30485 [Streptomyces sp. HUCO-GS316]|uniref:hypothetical protein n=1 Tax=Streptomyces sp. HUCO-GS316 TaxID=2692198 RepID=UPI00136DA424|nr:hypothetical protein [Streptomyces sp. HUCO-GS316]MXM67648.1 hypothetical protein [Streptomyces sp. HUCO-GS316]
MAVMTETLVPALEDAHHAHAVALDRMRADAAVAPPGPYQLMLESQADEIQDTVHRIERHVRRLRPRGLLGGTVDIARFAARTTVRTAMLPLTIGQRTVTGLLRGRGPADERQLLKNTEDQYAAAARALAATRAGEVLAEWVHDRATLDLLTAVRRQDEELLARLEVSLSQQARSVAAATDGLRVEEAKNGGLALAATRTVWAVVDRLREAARPWEDSRSAAEESVVEMSGVTGTGGQGRAAQSGEEDLPIVGFSRLSVEEIERRLNALSEADLRVLERYEGTHANRRGVLDAIGRLLIQQP